MCKDIDESFHRSKKEVKDSIVSDYNEGRLYLSENYPVHEIQLFIYMDAVNVAINPLGSAGNKYKLLAEYFTRGNLKPIIGLKFNLSTI